MNSKESKELELVLQHSLQTLRNDWVHRQPRTVKDDDRYTVKWALSHPEELQRLELEMILASYMHGTVLKSTGAHDVAIMVDKLLETQELHFGEALVRRRAASPPKSAENLLLFFAERNKIESLLGDLEELYRTVYLPKLGPRGAKLWYWKEILGDIFRHRLIKWVLAGGLAEIIRRLIS